MVVTNEELADKIVYLKENNYKPNFDKESLNVQTTLNSFYKCEKTHTHDTHKLTDNDVRFGLTFCNYQEKDKLVREINREFKRFQIKNIGKGEF